MRIIITNLILILLLNSPAYGSNQNEIDSWNSTISISDQAFTNNDLETCENNLKDAIRKAIIIKNNKGSVEYLIDSCSRLAELYKYENRSGEALQIYKYLDTLIGVDNNTYKLKDNISNNINELDSVVQKNRIEEQDKLRYIENQLDRQRSAQNAYDGSFLLRLNDFLNTTMNIYDRFRY